MGVWWKGGGMAGRGACCDLALAACQCEQQCAVHLFLPLFSPVPAGTSLPDTFASRWAAVTEDTADAAIGNITGSNSVNVLLGLGLPWVIQAVYYAAKVCGLLGDLRSFARCRDQNAGTGRVGWMLCCAG